MEKKYQVFVSSTFTDLIEERKEVIQALLELDCIPVGMEMFPAADEDQWSIIKKLIDDCDYYILIVGGRYGSVSPTGIGYTQMEYDYAIEKLIPTISFLPRDPLNIIVAKSDINEDARKKLSAFKDIVQKKLCKFYENPKDLGSVVSRSLITLIKTKPRPGWVRASFLPSQEATQEILNLTRTIEKLKVELALNASNPPIGTEDLSNGDEYELFNFQAYSDAKGLRQSPHVITGSCILTWNEIFKEVSPYMINECSDKEFYSMVNKLVQREVDEKMTKEFNKKGFTYSRALLLSEDFQTIKIQFRALNLITESKRKRAINDDVTYWTLTKYGDTVMTRLRAIKIIKKRSRKSK